MKIDILRQRVLDELPAEESCVGAVFTSYGFDPTFFEQHVLRAVLGLASDPVEQPERYHAEALRALQETPVVAIVDGGKSQPGRRLLYDLLEVNGIVFHPKSALLLYKNSARLMVGSGNLTFPGYNSNTELFLILDLAYDDAADAALLRAYNAHLDRISEMTRQRGTQLSLFHKELKRRFKDGAHDGCTSSVALLDSTTGPIMDQLIALLPDDAKIARIGMLAPFFERDDGGELDIDSVFGVLQSRALPGTVLDVGILWDNAQVEPLGGHKVASLESGLGRLWAWRSGVQDGRVVDYLTPTTVGPSVLVFIDSRGNQRRWPTDEARKALDEHTLWMLPTPKAFAPRQAIKCARKAFGEVNIWLHPSTSFLEGLPVPRPLHAKLLTIAYRSKGEEETLVLMGSANMSRRALLLSAGSGKGNVELGVAFRLAGAHSLVDFASELVHAPNSALDLKERDFPLVGRNYALVIDSAVHDPAARTLEIKWSSEATELSFWQLTYDGQDLARSDSPPTERLLVPDFVLHPSSAEVTLHVNNELYAVPILVTDLVALPAAPGGVALDLDELLLFLSGRVGAERVIENAKRRKRGKTTKDSDPGDPDGGAVFIEEGFGPTDVYRAWWAVAKDLCNPNWSISAFRLRLEGAMGVGEAWQRMLVSLKNEGSLSRPEVWFYGAELLRTLETEVDLLSVMDSMEKVNLLRRFKNRVRADLATVRFDGDDNEWVRRIQSFYGAAVR